MITNGRTSSAGGRRRRIHNFVYLSEPVPDSFSLTTMNFSRNLEAFRQYGAATDGTSAFAEWVGANTLVQENLGDAAGNLIRIEGERTCHTIRNRDLTATGWNSATFGTISRTQNAGTWGAVDGGTTVGTRITIPAGAPGGWGYSQNHTGLLSNPHRISCWIRGHINGGTLRTNYDALITGISIAGTTWQRVQRASTSTGGVWYPADNTANVGDAQDWYFDLMQAEAIGTNEPIGITSPVRTAAASVTRPKDNLTAIPENFPIWMLKHGKIPYISPGWASADQVDGMIAWVICWTAGDGIYGIRFNRDATDLRLEVLAGGVVKARSSALTFAAHDLLQDIVWDSVAGTLTVDGAAGTTSTWTWTLPTSDWRIGGIPASTGELFGRVSPIWSEPIEPSIRISGTVTIGGTLTSVDNGIITSKQWQRGNIVDGVGTYAACGGSDSGDTYIVTADDIGYSITCLVTGPGGSIRSNVLIYSLPSAYADWNADLGVEEASADPAEDADSVQFWRDQTGNVRDLAMATAGNRPIYRTTGGPNNHAAVDFTTSVPSTIAYMDTGGSIGLGSAVTILSVTQTPGLGRYVCDGMAANTRVVYNQSPSAEMRMYAGSFGGPAITAPAPGTWMVHAAVFNGASSKASINGGTDANGDVGVSSDTGHTVGAPGTGFASIYCLDAKLARQIIYNSAISDSARADATAYLVNWAAL